MGFSIGAPSPSVKRRTVASTQHLAGIGRLVGKLRRGPSNVVTKTPLNKLLTRDMMAEFERVIGSAHTSPKQAGVPLGYGNQASIQKLQLKRE